MSVCLHLIHLKLGGPCRCTSVLPNEYRDDIHIDCFGFVESLFVNVEISSSLSTHSMTFGTSVSSLRTSAICLLRVSTSCCFYAVGIFLIISLSCVSVYARLGALASLSWLPVISSFFSAELRSIGTSFMCSNSWNVILWELSSM